ncbi:MAG: hypothetical protein II981_00095, partial [Bacteroidales bacterium]|nr:hypothetical protein [Bacteroidales bacterium]
MRTKSFILTFLMMMFCSVSFGQNTNPDWGEFNYHDYAMNMEVIAKISLDGEAQTSTSIQVAAYCGNERRSEVVNVKSTPGGSLVQLQVFGVKGFPTDPDQTQTTEKITFKFYDGTSMFVSNEDMDFKGNHVVGDLFNPFTIEFKSVAKIGDVKYGSLQAAINAAQASDVIVLLADVVAETNPVNIPADVTLDLNTHTIKADIFGTVRTNNGLWITSDGYKMIGKDADIYASDDATVVNTLVNNVNTITIAAGNVTLAAKQYNEWWTAQGQELIIGENVTFTIPQGKKFNIESNTSVTINGTVSNEGTLAIKNDATVKGNITGDIHFLGGKYITAGNYNMVGTTSDYYYNTTDALVNIAGQFGDITIKSGEMTLGQSWRTVQGQTLTIASGAKFTVPANMTFEVFKNTHVIVNGTLVTDGTVYLQLNAKVEAAEGLNVTTNVADHKVVYEGGVYKVVEKVYIAQTETGAKFETLQEAVNAGTTVTLLDDATGAGVVIDKKVTIDFATYTYTVNQAVGSTGTETLGFQILKNNIVTLMNGTLTSSAAVEGSNEIKMLIQNYADLTLSNMNLVDNTDHISYALSNNSGNVNLDGNTNITTDKVAFDVYDYTTGGYAHPVVNVNTTGTISGKIEVSESISNNLNISGGTFTVEIEEAWCANGFIPVKNADNTWTVKVGEYVARNTTTGQGYETLVEAVAAAAADQEVKLLAAAAGAGLKINKDITIDFGGFVYTINEAVGSSGTESQGFQLLKEATEVTLQNGTVKVQDGAHVVWMINDYSAKLNVTNVIFNCEHMDLPNNDDASNVYFLVANNAHNQNPAVTLTDVEVQNFGSNFGSPYFMEPNTTIKSADANLDIEVDPGYRLVYNATQQTYSVEKLIAHFDGGAYARYAADKPREHFSINLYDVYASQSLVVKVYHDETLLLTTTYRAEDLDAPGVNRYPVSAERLTVNNVVSGKEAGSWLNEYEYNNYAGNKHFAVDNVPNKFEVYVDGTLTDTYNGTQNPNAGFSSAENLKTYLGFDGVYKAASVTRGTDVTYYMTLAEAFAAATQNGDIVTLYDNVTLASSLNVNRNVVLELNGYNIESSTIKAIVISNAQLTVNDSENNGVISAPQATLYVAENAKLIVNSGTIEGASAIQGNGSLNGTEVTINGGIIDGNGEIAIYHPQNGVLNINGGTIVGSAGVEMRAGTLNMTAGTVEATGTFATRKHDSGQTVDGVAIALSQHTTNHNVDINITGGTIQSSANGKAFYQDRLTVTYTPSTNITADIAATVEGAVEAAELGYNIVENNGIYSLVYVGFEAQIGEVKYETLVEAVEAAQAGETVTLLKSATGAGVVINKNVTIDFATYTYTVNQAVGSSGTETLGFQILKGNTVTLKNGTLTSTTPVVTGKEVKMLIQNYANLTVEDMNLVDNTTHIQYVLSNNSGISSIKGATNITTDAVAFDVYDYTAGGYALPTVNVNTTGKITGAIEVSESISNNLNISGGLFTAQIAEAWCADGFFPTEVEIDGNTYYTVHEGLLGSGTETDPFIIRSLGELKFFRDHVNAGKTTYNAEGVHVALAANIDMATEDWSVNIGDDCNKTFDGIFDGKGYTISNLNGTETAQKADGYVCTGLFGAIFGNAVIKNLTIENVNINTAEYTGNNAAAVVGFVYDFNGKTITIENVTVKGDVNINASGVYGVGAIVGYSFEGGAVNIKNCKVVANEGSVITATSGTGAIIGYCAGRTTIDGCTVDNIDITGKGLVGGIAGITSISNTKNLTNNTVKNVNLKATKAEWVNSTAIAVGTMSGDGLTVANTIFENVNASRMVGSVYAEQPTYVVPAVEARIENKYYGTFDAALEAAQEGNTITVLAPVVITEDETYDLTGLSVDGENVYPIFRIQNDAEVTVKGEGTITNDDYVFVVGASDSSSAGNLTIESGTYTGTVTVASVTRGLLTIKGGEFKVNDSEYGATYMINCIDANYNADPRTANVEIKGGTFHGFDPENNAAEGAGTNFCAEGYLSDDNSDGTYTVRQGVYVAQVNDGAKYESLVEAVAAAEDNDVVKLLDDAIGAGLVINKDITIDFGGFTYTINQAVGSTGTETQGFQLLPSAEDVKLMNGNIAVTAGTNVIWMINDYAKNLTVEDMTFDCSGMNLEHSAVMGLVINNLNNTDPKVVFGENVIFDGLTTSILLEHDTQLTAGEGWMNAIEPEDGYVVVYKEGVYTVARPVASITRENVTTEYATLGEATKAAVNGDVVNLLCDVNGSEVTVDLQVAKKITVDLGGHRYTSTGTAFIAYRAGTELTLTNGTVNGNGAAGGTLRATYKATLILGADLIVNAGPQATAIVIEDGKFFVNPNTEDVIVNGGIDCIKVQEDALEVSIASGTYTEDVQEWCADGYVSQYNGDGTWTVRVANYVAAIGETKYESLKAAIDAAQDGNTITVITSHELAETVIVNKNVNIDFATGVELTTKVYPTAFRITEGADVTVVNANIKTVEGGLYNFILGASDSSSEGNLTIKNGTFVANTTVASVTKGNLVIEGGDFSLVEGTTDYRYLINCIDANYNNETATVAISGGTFHNWNPQDNAAETGGHANFCAEGYGAVETSTGVWEVVPMQEMKLYAGWNWFSSYIDINGEAGLGRLQEALNPHGVQIKNDGGFTQYTEGQGWFGPTLESASVKEMYMINMSADHELQLKGELVDPAQDENAITLEHGWNWIGYQLNIGLNLENALAGFNPNHGDRIKSHQGFSQYYNNELYEGWWGTLETMTPGYGYMYYNANENDATLKYSYPADGSKSEVRANITSENNYWVPASLRYAGNMNIVAMLEADGDNYEIAAFVGGEVRGSARPIYVEPLDTYMFFLTVHGEDVEEMTFRVYDLATGEEYNLNDRMNYTDNAIVGSIT